MNEQLFDVIEIQLSPPHDERMIAEAKTRENAEAIVQMAVIRRGVENSIFATRPHPYQIKT